MESAVQAAFLTSDNYLFFLIRRLRLPGEIPRRD
jgi:hypothetical protein